MWDSSLFAATRIISPRRGGEGGRCGGGVRE